MVGAPPHTGYGTVGYGTVQYRMSTMSERTMLVCVPMHMTDMSISMLRMQLYVCV